MPSFTLLSGDIAIGKTKPDSLNFFRGYRESTMQSYEEKQDLTNYYQYYLSFWASTPFKSDCSHMRYKITTLRYIVK